MSESLTLLVAVPAVTAFLVAALPTAREAVVKAVGLIGALVTFALSIYVLTDFDSSGQAFQLESLHDWIPTWGISWHLGIDGISLFLVLLTTLLFPIALAGPPVHGGVKAYTGWMLVLEAGCIGSFLALDLFLFFVFFEIVLVPMYFLIGRWGYENRVYAATKFFLFTLAGSGLMLVGLLGVVFLHAEATGNAVTFDLVTLAENQVIGETAARWLFASFALAFAIKVPLFPVHTWLPDAHTQAPTAGSVILAGVLLKLGTYGLVRFGLYLFPEASASLAPVLLTLAVIGVIYGAVVATVQSDLKRLIAYSSVAHLGFIVLGTFAITSQSLSGGVLQMVNHGISTGALFLLVGMIYERRHTREIAELRGLWKTAPVLGGVFLVVMMSSIGVPGLNGFVGEFLILLGTFMTHRWWAVIATGGVILAALYLLWAFQRVFKGVPDEANANISDLTLRERVVLAPLLVLIVFIGVFPQPLLDRIEPSVDRLVEHVEEHDSGTPSARGAR